MNHDDYQRIYEGAAIGAVQATAQLAVAGKDHASFLQGFLTNDVEALEAGTGCYAAWLTPQGRMLTDLHVLESGGMALLDLPRDTAEATLARLDQFHFSEDVTFTALAGSLAAVWLHGPQAAATLERVLDGASGLASWPDHSHRPAQFMGESVVVARIDQLGVPGFCAYVPPAAESALLAALETAGAARVVPGAIEAARVEAVYPLFGIDMTEETIPLEAGLESRAISTTKGCYVGQEVIIRVLHRGHGRVAKKLVLLTLADTAPATVGAPVFSGEREVGRVTSAGLSPRSGSVALAYLHRDFLSAGTQVTVGGVGATVTDRSAGR